ncbi:CoA transferase [Bosea sp. LjRoot90]|uniref:CoA transferase n=1 Tax=Bosea sp. LjRoot90 TaxID=3342342 RepID=UPI003ECF12EA
MTARRPYAGLVVAEVISDAADNALVLAAGMAGRILADLGAEVVCHAGRERGFESSTELFLARGKTKLTANPGELLDRADVALVDGGLLREQGRAGLPPVTAVLSLFGGRLADSDRPAGAFTLAALGGLLAMVGDPLRAPLRLGGHQEAFALGLSTYCGVAAALASARPQGAPVTIRASLLETLVWLNWKAVPLEGYDVLPGRTGAASEWQVLRCADGYAVLVYQEPDWSRLKAALAEPALEESRFATRANRLAHLAELAAIIERRFLTLTRREIHALARQHRLPLGPVWSPADAFHDAHNRARGLFAPLGADPEVQAPRLPLIWLDQVAARRADIAVGAA